MIEPRTQPRRRTQPNLCVQNEPKVVAYLRVSTEEQARYGVSLDAQLAKLKAYCVLSGMQLAKVIRDEGVSGAKRLETRPGGAELVKLVRSKQVQAVLTLKLDRLFRDAADCLNQTRDWDQSGIALHVIDMGGSALNTASAVGRMFLTITAAFAELERNLIAERTSTALRHKRDNKKAYSPTPFGFDRDGDALATNSGEAEVVKLIQELHAKRWSLRAIAAELTRREIPTKQGKSWYASTVGKILANTIHQ